MSVRFNGEAVLTRRSFSTFSDCPIRRSVDLLLLSTLFQNRGSILYETQGATLLSLVKKFFSLEDRSRRRAVMSTFCEDVSDVEFLTASNARGGQTDVNLGKHSVLITSSMHALSNISLQPDK